MRMPSLFSALRRLLPLGGALCLSLATAAPPLTSVPINAVPPNISTSGSRPMMMLTSSKDHTLFGPMYTDFEDLDGDGIIDTTFKPDFKYYGYFDATKCYTYSTSDGRFNPAASATVSGGRYVCGGTGHWSGNFLNWATMTRLDVVRKMLYGGQRVTDSTTVTVLQTARLSRDSHSFVKYYRGTDIRDYTPFTTANLTKTGGANANVYAGLTMCMQADANDTGASGTPQIRMAKGNYRLWATVEGRTVCDWGSGALGNKLSRYYGGTAAYQGNGGVNHEINPPNQTNDGATYSSIGPVLNARVRVCDSSLLGEERCQAYGTSTVVYKPVGLLQEFGMPQAGSSAARTEFGLITGSYDRNLNAGALRKNMGDLRDEVKPDTGQFCFSSGVSCTGTLPDGRSYTSSGAIRALDQIILFGKTSGSYTGSNVQLPSEMSNGTLSAWGNPVGEMVVQALRYYGGLSSTNPTTTTSDASISMPVASWTDPLSDSNSVRTTLYGKSVCRPLNILALSSSALSFDGDDANTPFSALPNRSRGTLTDYTNTVGSTEGIHGTLRSVGSVTGGFGEECSAKTVATLDGVTGVCPEAPGVGGSYKVAGAALYANTNRIRTLTTPPPDLPNYALKVKTYAASLAGGVARVEVPIPNTSPQRYVYITPEGLWAANSNSKRMPAAMLTFNAISSSATHGAFIVTWNDSLFGGDYDMDIAGYLRYDISGTQLRVTTDIINVGAGWTGSHGFSIIGTNRDGRFLTHRHLNNDSTMSAATGYLCGQNAYRTATNLATLALPASGAFPGLPAGSMTGDGTQACDTSSGWNSIRDRDSPVTITFDMVGAGAVTLRDPLWYAAKYGSFTPGNPTDSNELPDAQAKWDRQRNDNLSCGGSTGRSCSDGEPDGYFLARRPELLEQRLRDALEQIISSTNAAPAVSSSRLSTDGYKYVAKFDPSQYSGSLEGYQLSSAGTFPNTPSWDAGQKLVATAPSSRQVITNDGTTGVALATGTTFSTDFSNALRGTGAGALTATQANELIDYLRGDRSREKPAGIWRTRSVSTILGPIVNSSPWLQLRPSAKRIGTLPANTPTYASFAEAQKARIRPLWVGSNDGMLHAFHSGGSNAGEPILSYLPSPLVGRARALAQDMTSIQAGMDGSPFTGDVLLGTGGASSSWKTYLFSSLGRGGRAVFALDVTNPSALTQSNAASIFEWMFSSDDDADLGYVLGNPQVHPQSNQASQIVRMNNGKFALLVPNGVGSANGRSFVYVLFVDGPSGSNGAWTPGTDYVKLATDTTNGGGMMGINWVDLDGNGTADVIYGTDLQGRLWKFDVRGAGTSSWASAFVSGTQALPMFEARDSLGLLPISVPPTISFTPFGGVMLAFGTGKSIASDDFPDSTRTQRFYSIYDKANWGTTSPINSNLSTMLQRTVVRMSDGSVYVSVGATAFNKDTHSGWYFNFPPLASGSTVNSEMVLFPIESNFGELFFTAVRPSVASADKCYALPDSTQFVLDPVSGTPRAGTLGTVEVAVGGTTITINRVGKQTNSQIDSIVLFRKNGSSKNKLGTVNSGFEFEGPPNIRRHWREIPNARTFD